jgi:hypothetical protein
VDSDDKRLPHVRFGAHSGLKLIDAARPLSANFGSREDYSITSSARASNVGGTVRPIALAALRLMTNSNFVGA